MVARFSLILILLSFVLTGKTGIAAQESPNFHVVVNMVQLNVAVTDKKGNYITGLRPQDFAIVEDGIVEKAATFAEGNGPARSLNELGAQDASPEGSRELGKGSGGASAETLASLVNGANVFVLFDTSDYMYRGFVFAQDAITEFVHSLGTADKIAFYSYSRDLSRAASLTSDRSQVVQEIRRRFTTHFCLL
jgi:Ca-activated chloride channel homolog